MAESWKTRAKRWAFNLFPAYRGTGGRVTHIADDWHTVRIKLPLNWRTRNYVGTVFGGSIYGAVDPFYMVMLINILGRDYIVWDKAATVRFKRPGKETLYAEFVLTPEEIAAIKTEANTRKSFDRIYTVELKNAAGKVHALVEKTLYIAHKESKEK